MDFNLFTEKLSKNLSHSDFLTGNAAVVALLRENNQQLEILFVKRTKTPKDPWSGQTAFPGGKLSSADHDLKDTVIRETCEETSLNLRKGCRFLGALEPINAIQRPSIKILPFVVWQLEKQEIRLNHELSNYFWAPLLELTKNKGITQYNSKDYPAYIIENHVVWGITYQISNSLLSKLQTFLKS